MAAVMAGQSRTIDWWSFEFDSMDVPAVSTAGNRYVRKAQYGMPRIPREILNSVVYLYKSREDAESGEDSGGTGFLIGLSMPEVSPGAFYAYVVTNWHVAVRGGASVVRVNKIGGGVDIFDLDPSDWHFKPGWHDLAVADLPTTVFSHNVTILNTDMIVRPDFIQSRNIGPGEDVFMVGRFVDHDGSDTSNVPATRFGNISVMPRPIPQFTGATHLGSYILDIHSRSGYSGSPVFVYRTPGSDLTTPGLTVSPQSKFLGLLAVHWGQFPEEWEIKEGPRKKTRAHATALNPSAQYIEGWSGMTLAIPADAILELLDLPALKSVRDQFAADEKKKYGSAPMAEAAQAGSEGSNPSHREDFTSLLNAAVKPQK